MKPVPVIFRPAARAALLGLAAAIPAIAAAEEIPCGQVVATVVCRADATQSYALYLPSVYDPKRAWPVLYCFDPGGRGHVPVELFQAAAEKFGYVVAGSNNSRNGPWADNLKAIEAMVHDTGVRFSLDGSRRYAVGMSGGARVATEVAATGLVRGAVACSAAFSGGETPRQVPFVLFGTAGTDDFNCPEMRRTDRDLDARGTPHRVVFFAGGHGWPPPELAMEAVGWLELQAMRAGKRPKDEVFIHTLFESRRAATAALPPAGAWREYQSLAADFSGLVDTADVARRAAALAGSREIRAAEKQERQLEQRQLDLNDELYADARDGRLARLREAAAGLRRQAAAPEDSPDRRLARRVLEGMGITSAEQARQLLAQHEYGDAAMNLELAAILHPDRPRTHYELARARALNGERAAALAALQAAVTAGFKDAAQAEQEAAFARLRPEPSFQQLLAAMKP